MSEKHLTPEAALDYLDNVRKKYQGTYDDHLVLNASVETLKVLVVDWRRMKTEEQRREQEERKKAASSSTSEKKPTTKRKVSKKTKTSKKKG